MQTNPQLSVVIPAYNEEASLAKTVGELARILDASSVVFEIICVNNCSKDQTATVATTLAQNDARIKLVHTPALQGYGIAVRTGLHYVTGDTVAIYMADGSDSPSDLVAYFKALQRDNVDCAFGTRFSGATTVTNYPKIKIIFNRAGNSLLSLISGKQYDDFTNGFKCYKTEFLRSIGPFVSSQFNLTIEMSLKSVMAGGRFTVVPNSWQERDFGQSNFKVIQQSVLYLVTLVYVLLDRLLKQKNYETMRRNGLTF